MKKIVSLILIFVFCVLSFNIGTYANNNEQDPYYDFHMQISSTIEEMRFERNKKIQAVEDQMDNLKTFATDLLNERATYSVEKENTYKNITKKLSQLNSEVQEIKKEYSTSLEYYLENIGFVLIDDNIDFEHTDKKIVHTSASTNANYMQTTSTLTYFPTTKDFYYYVEYDYNQKNLFGAYIGLSDSAGDYDLVSMQHKETMDWYWNNIIVTAEFANAWDATGSASAGKADKYRIINNCNVPNSPSRVSNRNDFWNGCVFNVDDTAIKYSDGYDSEIRYVTLEGWLQSSGTATSSAVKSEYEHNYQKWVFSSVTVSGVNLNDSSFSMEVSYSKSSGVWQRSAGSRVCILP